MRGRYKESSAGVQFIILFMLGLGGALIFSALGAVFASLIYEIGLVEIFNDPMGVSRGSIDILKFLQIFSSIGTFLVPALIAGYLFASKPGQYLGFNSFSKPFLVVLLLVVVAICGSAVSDILFRFSRSVPWPESLHFIKQVLDSAEAMMAEQIQRFLVMEDFSQFSGVFFIMAVLPALGEELLFRGVLQPVIKKGFGNPHLAIWLSAFLFSIFHQQVYAFLSILILGVVLGYIREWSGSLWPSVILHLINNGTIIVAVYFLDIPYDNKESLEAGLDWGVSLPMIIGFAIGLGGLYFTFSTRQKRESPL